MSLQRLSLILVLSAAVGTAACTGEAECEYQRPVASLEMTAGNLLADTEHTFSAEDSIVSCDREFSYTWSFLKVPEGSNVSEASIAGQNSPSGGVQSLFFDLPGTYVMQVVVYDGIQNSVEAIEVVEISADNLPPEANAGEDQAAVIGGKAVFDGSESYDPEDQLQEYLWRLEEAPAHSSLTSSNIFAADTDTAEFVPDVDGTYVFSLQVRDEFVWSAKDYVSLVTPIDNQAPVSQASDFKKPDYDLTPCQSLDPIQLNGTRSYDPEGESLDYEWSLVSAPDGSRATDSDFSDVASARPLFTADEPGAYTFQLRVNDGVLWSAWDYTTVTTFDIGENVLPEANAGSDVTIEGRAKCRNVGGTWKCPECPSIAFELDASAGTVDANGDDLSYLWVQTAGPDELDLSYPGGPITTARPAAATPEYGEILSRTYTLEVRTSDCEGETSSTVNLTFECEGTN